MTTAEAEVDVVYIHGVGGPSLDWHHHVPATIGTTRTVSFDDLMGRPPASNSPIPVVVPSRRRWRAPYYERRETLAGAVADAAAGPQGNDGSRRWRPPVVVPTALLVRSPFFNMADASQYRTDPQTRAVIAGRLIDAIGECERPVVLLAHSLGSVIAVDVLHEYRPRVDLLLTIGSPIGVDLDWCSEWVGSPDFPTATLGGWLNVINTRDPIPWNRAVEPRFPQAVDAYVSAGLLPFGPGGAHDPVTYLRTDLVQHAFEWATHLR